MSLTLTQPELVAALAQLVGVQTLEHRLWDCDDVATYLNLSVQHVRRHITPRSDFPAPVDLPGAGMEPIRRYRGKDVREWSERFRR